MYKHFVLYLISYDITIVKLDVFLRDIVVHFVTSGHEGHEEHKVHNV